MDVIKYLENYHKSNNKLTLKAMEYLVNEFGHPEDGFKIIHIAGTNGKGSVTEMLTNILINAGYKVGKFLSPHLIEYNERISINNKNINNKDMEKLIKCIEQKIKKYNEINDDKVTLFELLTIMAFVYFKKQKCDFVVIETGLGGLYDSTNIVNPMVSIITSIGYDHMGILGDTLEQIAIQKAGIIKRNSNTVIMEQSGSIQKIIENTCKQKNNTLKIVKKYEIKNKRYKKKYLLFDYMDNKDIKLNLKGDKQFENAAICIETVNIIKNKGYNISDKAIEKGLSTVIHKARFETLNKCPEIIYDGGHNEEAILNLVNTVNTYYKKQEKIYIISILKRKDYKTVLNILLKDENASFIFTSGNSKERYVSKEELYEIASKITDNKRIYKKDLKEAISYALLQKEKVSFVVGSFYIYGDVVNIIRNNKINKRVLNKE